MLRDYNLRLEYRLSVTVTLEAEWKCYCNPERRKKERGLSTPGLPTVPLHSGNYLLDWMLGQLPMHVMFW